MAVLLPGCGGTIDLGQYAGKVVLVVNTASQCSFTKQYGPLQALYETYRDRGFVVVGVPSNDFGGQDPGSNDDIVQFTQAEFSVDFPIAAKSTPAAAPPDAHFPVYSTGQISSQPTRILRTAGRNSWRVVDPWSPNVTRPAQ